jgi:WD40 repeat protein/tRNA A-37 threonylcarbamoyl transferase component Bud32
MPTSPPLEESLERLHEALHRGERPELTSLLPAGAPVLPALRELVHAELDYRWKQHDPVRVEEYLQRYPALRADSAAVVSLVLAEVKFRRRDEPDLSTQEYLERFPEHAAALEARLPVEAGAAGRFPQVPGYEILGELGRGGMGIVYKARQKNLNRLVALKMVLDGGALGSEELSRLRIEAEAVARLQHSSIVQLYEMGSHAGCSYLALEYVEGVDLETYRGGRPLPCRLAAELVETVARAVEHAHRQGILHRDLKPANILLADPPATAASAPDLDPRSARVTDFGLARRLTSETRLTHTGQVLGTPGYMAPEQATGTAADLGPAVDVYALGAILYALLCGTPPFRGPSPLETLRRQCSDEPVPPRRLEPRTPRDLEVICLKCLARDPRQRYPSAGELADDLRRFRAGEPIAARPATPLERGGRWLRRHPTLALVAVLFLLAAGGAAALARWYDGREEQRVREDEERQRVEQNQQRDERFRRYAHDLRAVSEQWLNPDGRLALDLLARHEPRPDEEDSRGPEWYWLRDHFHRDQLTLRPHGDAVHAVAFSPDGTLLASAGQDGSVKLWHRQGPCALTPRATLDGHDGPVYGLAFSSDGRKLASAGADTKVRMWDVDSTGLLLTLSGHAGPVRCVAFGDGSLVSGGDDGMIRVWDSEAGGESALLPGKHERVSGLAFYPNGKTLASAGDLTLKVWDVAKRELRFTTHGQSVPAQGIVFHPNGGLFAPGAWSTRVSCYRADNGSRTLDLAFHPDEIRCLATCPTVQLLATGGETGVVRLWELSGFDLLHDFRGHTRPVTGVAVAPDGQTLASAGLDGTLRLWDVTNRAHRRRLGHEGVYQGLAISPDGKTLAAGWADYPATFQVRLFALATGRVLQTLSGFGHEVPRILFSPDGKTLATVDHTNRLRLWEVATGRERACGFRQQYTNDGIAFSPDGKQLLLGREDGRILVCDATTLAEQASLEAAPGRVNSLAFSANGKTLFAGSLARTQVKRWHTDSWEELAALEFDVPVAGLACAHQSDLLAVALSGVRVVLWDVKKGEEVARLQHHIAGGPREISFWPGDSTLAVAGGGYRWFWDVPTRTLRRGLRDPGNYGDTLAFHPRDGRTVATIAREKTPVLWDLETYRIRRLGETPLHGVAALAFTPDGKTLITASKDPPVRFVRAETNFLVRELFATGRLREPVTYHRNAEGDVDIRCWDVATRQERAPPPDQCSDGIYGLALTPDGRTLLAAGRHGNVWLRRLPDQNQSLLFANQAAEQVWKWNELTHGFHPDSVREGQQPVALAVAPDGRRFATGSMHGTVRIWDTAEARLLYELPRHHRDLAAVTFSPNGQFVLANDGGDLLLWDAAHGELRQTLPAHDSPVTALAFAPDGSRLAVGAKDGRILLRDWPKGTSRLLEQHARPVPALAFSPDGRRLVSGDEGGLIKVWHPATGLELATLRDFQVVRCLAFSPDGRTLAAGGDHVSHWRGGAP